MAMGRWGLGLLGAALLAAGAVYWGPRLIQGVEEQIVVGLIHSRTGPLEVVEGPMLDAEILALEEINQAGGLLGRRLTWVVADGRSDPVVFGQEARRLIEVEKASVLFGSATAACRRAMEQSAATAKRMVFFATAYEGMEVSSDIIGTGPMPNQQAVPAVSWCLETLKAKKFFLAGISDVSSYAIHAVVRDQLKAVGGSVAGEAFVGLDGSGMDELVAAAKASGADVVISSVVGDANKAFFNQMTAAGLTAETLPVVCLRVSEDDLRRLPPEETTGHYAAWAYFQSVDDDVNRRLVERFKAKYKSDRTVSDPAASAYYAVRLWAQAVEEADSVESVEVREQLSRQSVQSGVGVFSVDHDMLHVWRPIQVGKIRKDGQFDVVWNLPKAVRPVSYPVFRSRAVWQAALARWRATGKPGIDEPAAAPPANPTSARPTPTATPPVVWGPRGAVRSSAPPAVRSAATPRPAVR
ncbi:transporter substrate-binding protein [Paludisphaera mucosa]|uniref:Transporter substrate-binding protein n=1 Tax=Paludisphaera mucosa TaxID=3030827 RepID=A0ABT6FBQ9_9BACT|nr:transporter substrate-binding protein [Paludisphaera mucosa]MDG3004879.1 transporter substrate-binding protein [Paludisphaera mucosa]